MRRIIVPGLVVLASGISLAPIHQAAGRPAQAIPSGSASAASGGAWLDPAWGYRIPISVSPDSIQGTGTLLSFPVLAAPGSDEGGLFLLARADGGGLRVTKRDGVTLLPLEVVHYDAGGQRAELWFRADSLSKSVHDFYLYFGNPAAGALGGSPFPSEYLAVYHFQDDPAGHVLHDSGPNGHDAVAGLGSTFNSADTLAGPIGRSWRFNGVTSWIDADGIASNDSSFTISGWFGCWDQFKSGDADFAFGTSDGWHLSVKRNNTQRYPDYVIPGGQFIWQPQLPDTLNHSFVWAMDGVNDTIRFYFDGVERPWWNRYPSSSAHIYTGRHISGNVSIGASIYGNSLDQFEGSMDEFRIRTGALTPEWIRTEYRNEHAPETFLLYGPAETPSQTGVAEGPLPPARILLAQNRPNPWRGSTRIGFTLRTPGIVRLGVYAPDGREVVRLADGFYDAGEHAVGWGGRDRRGERVAPGVYFYRLDAGGASLSRALILLP